MDDDSPNKSARPSPSELTRERENFVRNFLRKGVELTEELLRENDDLRARVQLLEADNAALRTQVKSDDAMRDVLRTIERLEQEKRSLLDRSSQLEQLTRRHEGRYAAIEQELNDLANLYVASFQLHSTLRPGNVLQHIKELLAQLVGAERFCVYVLSDDGRRAIPVGSEGLLESELLPIEVGQGAVGSVCATGVSSVKQGNPLGDGTVQEPLAILPMQVDGQTVGVISIVALLPQKQAWVQVDQELFHLLGSHAAAALLAAHLYQRQPDLLSALAGLGDGLK
jgi:hypothetical protein